MAKDQRPNAADKGKGKVDDIRELNGEKKDAKDGKPLANGKKEEGPKEGMERRTTKHHIHLVFGPAAARGLEMAACFFVSFCFVSFVWEVDTIV